MGAVEMDLNPHMVSFPVFRFLRCATRNHAICQKEKFLNFRECHISSHTPGIIQLPLILSVTPDEIFIR